MEDQEDCVYYGDCDQPTLECDAFCKFYKQNKKYTIYWKSGQREVVSGPTIAHAFSNAGLGAGSRCGIDFYIEGECDRYEFDHKNKSWWAK